MRPDIDGYEAFIPATGADGLRADMTELIAYIRELEAWANGMPDAGLRIDDPRHKWWLMRPCASGGPVDSDAYDAWLKTAPHQHFPG